MIKKIFYYIYSILLVSLAILTMVIAIGIILISNDFFGIKKTLKENVYEKYPNLEAQYRKNLFTKISVV